MPKDFNQEDLARFRVPGSVFYHYPLLNQDSSNFFASDLFALDDPFLTATLMKTISSKLLIPGVTDPSKNFLISPIYTPDQILKAFPRVRISCCEQDPFRDPIQEMIVRMNKLGLDAKMTLLKQYIHGSHSFVYEYGIGVEEYRNAVNSATQVFKELLSQ